MSVAGHRSEPALSVVIPSYRDPESLELTLSALTRQTLPTDRYEVIVVRDGEAPGYEPIERFRRDLHLSVVTLPRRRGRAAARNAGIERAAGAAVLFLDSDSYATPELVERHARAHDAGVPRVLIGLRYELGWAQLDAVLRDEPLPAELRDSVDCRDLRFPHGPAAAIRQVGQAPWLFAYTHNVSVSRKLLTAAGGFDDQFGTRWGWEDLELFYRVYLALGRDGNGFELDPAAVCYHLPHYRNLGAWHEDYFANQLRTRQLHPSLDWEFAGAWPPIDVADKVHRYRNAIADCLATGACQVPAVWRWVGGLPAGSAPSRVLWIGTGTAELPLGEGATTFDYGQPPSQSNLHLIGVATPIPDASLDAVVSVNFWRCLGWADLCLFLAESLRVAATVWLVCTDVPVAGSAAPGDRELAYLTRTLRRDFDAELVTGDPTSDPTGGASWPVAVRIGPKDT